MPLETLPRTTATDEETLGSSIAVRFTPTEREQLQRMSARNVRDVSQQIRFIVREYMRQHPLDNAAGVEGSAA